MATIVEYGPNGQEYILLGAGFGASMFLEPGFFSKNDRGEKMPLAVVCDASGKMHWVRTSDLIVVTVDGHRPGEVLSTRGIRPSDLQPINPDEA